MKKWKENYYNGINLIKNKRHKEFYLLKKNIRPTMMKQHSICIYVQGEIILDGQIEST